MTAADPSGPSLGTDGSGYTTLHLGRVDHVRVTVDPSPLTTLISLVVHALGGPQQGVPPEWTRMVRRAIPSHAILGLAPMFDPRATLIPDCLTPVADGLAIDDQLDRLAALPPELVRDSILTIVDGPLPVRWRMALEHPERLLRDYVTVMRAAWQAFQPVWRQTAGLRAREVERIGVAAVTGSLDMLLAGLSDRTRFADDTLYLPDRLPYATDLAGRQVVLVPLASGSRASVFQLDEPDLVWLGYPLPGLHRYVAAGEEPPPVGDSLVALLGPVRAAILRLLARPMTMGALARRVNAAPSTVTYHCGQLAAAGLVVRHREGREVRVTRTGRGDAVVELLSS